jgi:hypothetical protein
MDDAQPDPAQRRPRTRRALLIALASLLAVLATAGIAWTIVQVTT